MRVGVVILPEHSWSSTRDLWRRAEDLGFDHAWTYDHLAWRTLRDGPWFGAIPTLTAAALVTERIRLGPLVASPNFRHPVPFAKELITLDDMSGGRLTLGIGSGGVGWDATVLGNEPWPPRERSDRFAEFVDLTDRLSASPRPRSPAASIPPTARVHIPDACNARASRSRSPPRDSARCSSPARYGDTWVTTGDRNADRALSAADGAALVRGQMDALDEACASVGRDPSSIARLVLTGLRLDSGMRSDAELDDTIARYADTGVTDFVVHWPRADSPFAGDAHAFERIFANRK